MDVLNARFQVGTRFAFVVKADTVVIDAVLMTKNLAMRGSLHDA